MNLTRVRTILYYCCKPISPRDLERKTGYSHKNIFKLLDHGLKMGLIKKEGRSRGVLYSNTDTGFAVLDQLNKAKL